MDKAVHRDHWDNYDPSRPPTKDQMRFAARAGRKVVEEAMCEAERLKQFADRLEQLTIGLGDEFDSEADRETTKDAFAKQASRVRLLIDELALHGEGREMDAREVLKRVYGDLPNPEAYGDDLAKAAKQAKKRMDARNTPLTLVIDRHWLKIVRRSNAPGDN